MLGFLKGRNNMNTLNTAATSRPPYVAFQREINWNNAPVWADSVGRTPNGCRVWFNDDRFQYIVGNLSRTFYSYAKWSANNITLIEHRPEHK